jgi:nitric oxide dioxygenase
MRATRKALLEKGISAERIHYEVFGPDLWAQNPDSAEDAG